MALKFLVILGLACCLTASAALLPERIGKYERASAAAVTPGDQPLWQEYGLQQAETATYQAEGEKFALTGWRLQDSTGAMGAFQWQRPVDSKPSPLGAQAAETADGVTVVHHNYLLAFTGHKPDNAELLAVVSALKNVDSGALPTLPSFLPGAEQLPNSQRYILGPVGLAKFAPAIAPSTAGFHQGAEAQLARFKLPAAELTLAIFEYPTQQIARLRVEEFNKTAAVMAKRSGPLVAAVLSPPNADAAEFLLSQVRYRANLTMDEYVPTKRDNIGVLVINAFELIGILLAFCAVSGLAFGGWRLLRSKKSREEEGVITLHLADR